MQANKVKVKHIKLNMSLNILNKVNRQFNARFFTIAKYLEWLVPTPKKVGKVWICVNQWDLNKASLKDDFSLSHIDVFIHNTVGNAIFSFKDCFYEYN